MNKKLFRILCCVELMASRGRLRFFTMTVKEHSLPLRSVADRFRTFSNSRWWRRTMKGRDYICVYEPHPSGHGWHIHILTNVFIPWQDLQYHANCFGFGHTDIEACDSSMALYIGKYLSKGNALRSLEDSKNVRLVNVSRSLLPLYDVLVNSPSIDFVRDRWHTVGSVKSLSRKYHSCILRRYQWLFLNWVCSFCPLDPLSFYSDFA